MDVLREIVQSQMWTSPFRHVTSRKTLRLHSTKLAQIKWKTAYPMSCESDAKDYSDDEEEEEGSEPVNQEDDDEDEILGNDWMKMIHLEAESDELYDILYSTMRGEGNTSVLLFGRNGFGKSALLSTVMHRIEAKCGKDAFIFIYLNANLQTTDVDSLYEIVSQLARQNGRDFNVNLFDEQWNQDSPSLDIGSSAEMGEKKKFKKSEFVDNLEFLVNELKKVTMDNFEINNKNKKPIFIVLDHFELFARRHKQTLLYNLFDLNQSNSSLLNIIGITNKKSVYESLEKRIRSRFIHKKIFVPEKSFLSDGAFKLFFKIVYNAMVIPNHTRYFVEGQSTLNGQIKTLITRYNQWIDDEVLDQKEIKQYLRKLHRFGYSPSRFLVIAGLLSSIVFQQKYFMKKCPRSTIKGIIKQIDGALFEDPFLRMINNLGMNQLFVLIVAAKFDSTKDAEFNFEIIYRTIQNVQRQDHMNLVVDKHVYYQCYRQLIALKFLTPISTANKINIGQSSTNILSKIFHANFDMVRLNKRTDGADILRYIAQNVKEKPSWIESWLLNNKTHICL